MTALNNLLVAALVAALPGSVAATAAEPLPPLDPAAFAAAWPIVAEGTAVAFRIELPAAVYAQATRSNLGDVVVVDAEGRAVPTARIAHGVLTERSPLSKKLGARETQRRRRADGTGAAPLDDGDLRVDVERDGRGRVRVVVDDAPPKLQITSPPDSGADSAVLRRSDHAWKLITVRRIEPRLVIDFDAVPIEDGTTWTRASFEFDSLDTGPLPRCWLTGDGDRGDVSRWHVPLEMRPLDGDRGGILDADLSLDGRWPAKAQLECFGPGVTDGFRLLGTELAGQRIRRLTRDHAMVVTGAVAETERAGRYDFPPVAPLPFTAADISVEDANVIAELSLVSGNDPRALFAPRGSGTVQTLKSESHLLHLEFGAQRDRNWRVVSTPPLPSPPKLKLSWQGEFLMFLAQGKPPFRLIAGNARPFQTPPQVDNLLAEIAKTMGNDWVPPEATLGDQITVAGERAREPRLRGDQWTKWLLWGLLVAGVLAVGVMVMRLLKEPKRQEP